MSRIYLASPFSRYQDAIAVKRTLEALGHRVVASWLGAAAETRGLDTDQRLVAKRALDSNSNDIRRAQVFLALVWPGLGQQMWAEAEEARSMGRPLHFFRMVDGAKLPLLAIAHGQIHDSLGAFVAALALVPAP